MNKSVVSYNMLPLEIRKIPKIDTFKKKLKLWIQVNRDLI